MSITTEEVKKVASLARIAINDQDIKAMASDIGKIMTFMEQLTEVDVSNIAPMTGCIDMPLKLRDDQVTDGNIADKILPLAPDSREGFFVVTKVVE